MIGVPFTNSRKIKKAEALMAMISCHILVENEISHQSTLVGLKNSRQRGSCSTGLGHWLAQKGGRTVR